MTYEEQRRTIVRERPDPVEVDMARERSVLDERRVVRAQPSASTVAARVVMLVFGIIQLLIALRVLLLAIDAREGNVIVSSILSLSQPLVAPFEGMLRSDALHASGAVLDLAAIVAFIGWTIVELVVLAIVRLGRPSDID